jgi:hypothetical protein
VLENGHALSNGNSFCGRTLQEPLLWRYLRGIQSVNGQPR